MVAVSVLVQAVQAAVVPLGHGLVVARVHRTDAELDGWNDWLDRCGRGDVHLNSPGQRKLAAIAAEKILFKHIKTGY